jgi:methionine salvage enolase-phosphatase E1
MVPSSWNNSPPSPKPIPPLEVAALVARVIFQGTEIIFVSASPQLLDAAKAEGFHALDPAREAAQQASED